MDGIEMKNTIRFLQINFKKDPSMKAKLKYNKPFYEYAYTRRKPMIVKEGDAMLIFSHDDDVSSGIFEKVYIVRRVNDEMRLEHHRTLKKKWSYQELVDKEIICANNPLFHGNYYKKTGKEVVFNGTKPN